MEIEGIVAYALPIILSSFGFGGLIFDTLRNYDRREGLRTDDEEQPFGDAVRKHPLGWKMKGFGYLGLFTLGLMALGYGLSGVYGGYY